METDMDTHDTQAAEAETEALRGRFRAYLERRGLTLGEAARGVGMSAPAVSSWLGAKYRGDNARVAELVARWLDTEDEMARMRSASLDRHAELSVTLAVAALAAHAQANRDCVLVYGAAGAGKSYALERFCAMRSGAVYVSMSPAETTPTAVLSLIAEALDVGAGVTSAWRLRRVVARHLAGRGALLVVDEAHHLTAALLDLVRCVYDAAGCGLVLAGNDPLWARLAATERAGQLISRIGRHHKLRRPSDADILELARVLLQRAPAGQARKAVLGAGRGLGGLRAVAKLIGVAATLARGDGRADIHDAELVEAAADMPLGA